MGHSRHLAVYCQFDDRRAAGSQCGRSERPTARPAITIIILIARHETTVNLFGNGTLVLLQHPDQLARRRSDPELIRPAIEELLRHRGPVEGSTDRCAAEEIEIGGVTIPKGAMVSVMLGSANRAPERFEDADGVDLTRDTRQHVAFG